MTFAISPWWRRMFSSLRQSKVVYQRGEIPSFENIFPRAELLISYAATAGIALDDKDVKLLATKIEEYKTARKTSSTNNVDYNYADVLSSYSRIAKQLLPVTAITLCECSVDSRRILQRYAYLGTVYVFLILLASFFTFVSSTISDSIKTEIDLANSKIITLRAHLGYPAQEATASLQASNATSPTYNEQDKLMDLQQLAVSSRSIYDRATQLHHLIFFSGMLDLFAGIRSNKSPDEIESEMRKLFDFDPALQNPYSIDFPRILKTYQTVRAYAESLREFVTFWYGGMVASILPVFYALLGASAWSLRQTQIKIRAKTFDNGDAKSAQYLVAAIAGTVIGLFSGLFVSSGVSLSPLAWAFLAGYSSDVLFQVLDGVLRNRVRNEPNPQTVSAQVGSAS